MSRWMRFLPQKPLSRLLLILGLVVCVIFWAMRPIQGIATSAWGKTYQWSLSCANYMALYLTRGLRDPAFGLRMAPSSDVRLDIVIPMIERDRETAVFTIASVRQMVMHPLGKIYLIAPDTAPMRAFAQEQGCILVPEQTVTPNFESLKKQGGWIMQQFLKLGADSFVEQENYLVVDADTVLLRPQVFITKGGQHLINVHWDYTTQHKEFDAKALGIARHYVLDFVPHHMMFNKTFLNEMKAELERRHGAPWWAALERLSAQHSGLSEYDLYATHVITEHPDQSRCVANANITLHRDHAHALPNVLGAYAADHKSLSMHHFILVDPPASK